MADVSEESSWFAEEGRSYLGQEEGVYECMFRGGTEK